EALALPRTRVGDHSSPDRGGSLMVSWIGRFLAVALPVSIGASAHATTQVVCNQLLVTGAESSQCANTVTDEHTDPTSGIQSVGGTATASADLATGSLHSRSVAEAYRFGPYDLNAGSGSIAELQDTITIGGGYTGTVQVRMDASGAFLLNVPDAA